MPTDPPEMSPAPPRDPAVPAPASRRAPGGCTGTRHGTRPLHRGGGDPGPSRIRPSRMSRRRTAVLVSVHVVFAIHLTHWWMTGTTLSPIEPSESMETLETGRVNAGFIFFAAAILATLVFGRIFCGWGCHIVALQDLCGALMKRAGIRPVLFRSRLLAWVPVGLAFYMFVWPTLRREVIAPLVARAWPGQARWLTDVAPFPGFENHLVKSDFWATFPPIAVAIPFLLICGFAVVYVLGAKGFCAYGCPYGGVFGPVDKLAAGKIVVDLDACEGCGHCTARCTSNVRVHEEIQTHGMVVDTGCMKCMDCVSVCPNDALSYRFARPTLFAGSPRRPPKRRRYDVSLGADALLLALFLAAFLGLRGAYGLVPMLMSVGVGLTTVFLAWKLVRVVRERRARLHRFELARDGRLTRSGRVFLAIAGGWLLLVVHTSAVNVLRLRGEALDRSIAVSREAVFSGDRSEVPSAMRERAARARRLLGLAAPLWSGGAGLIATPGLDLRLAWLSLVAGDPEDALPRLDAHRRRHGETPELTADLARVRALTGDTDGAIAALEAAITAVPSSEARAALARLYLDSGNPEAAVHVYEETTEPLTREDRRRLAELYLRVGRPDSAIQLMQRASVAAPDDVESILDLVHVMNAAGRTSLAISQLRRALSRHPDDPALSRLLEMLERESSR